MEEFVSESVAINGQGQHIALRYIGTPLIQIVGGSLFIARAVVGSSSTWVVSSGAGRVVAAIIGPALLIIGLSMLSTKDIQGDRLTVHHLARARRS